MSFTNYLEDEKDKPYFTTNSLAYYYDKMEGFAKAVEGSAKALNLTKEEVEKRLTLYIEQNKNELDQRLAAWDENLETFEPTVSEFMDGWLSSGGFDEVISDGLLDFKNAVSEVVRSKNLLNPSDPNYLLGKFISPTTGLISDNPIYFTTGYIDVTPGKKINRFVKATSTGQYTKTSMRFITAFNGTVLQPTLGSSIDVTDYTIPQGVNRLRISYIVQEGTTDNMIHETVISDNAVPVYEPYYKPYSRIVTETDKTLLKANTPADAKSVGEAVAAIGKNIPAYKNPTAIKKSDTLAAGGSITIPEFPNMLKNGQRFTYSAKLSSLSASDVIKVGFINSSYGTYQSWLEITSTHVKWLLSGTNAILSQPHGLTLSEFVTVSVNVRADTARLEIVVTSLNGTYTFKQATDSTRYNAIGVLTAQASVPTSNVTLSGTCTQFKKPTWIVIDSYGGDGPARIGGRLMEWGYAEGVLISGVGGLNSQAGYDELKRLLRYGTPKTLVWYLGMNDNATTVATYFPLIEQICLEQGISLIFNRIPFVPSRLESNKAVNDYVLASGKRYVNSYEAVGSDVNGTWYPGHIDPDGVHPASLGGAGLTGKLLADVPEILI